MKETTAEVDRMVILGGDFDVSEKIQKIFSNLLTNPL
jgi:hypothetical protein